MVIDEYLKKTLHHLLMNGSNCLKVIFSVALPQLYSPLTHCSCPPSLSLCFSLSCLLKSQNSYDEEDYEGSERLGRKAFHMAIASMIIGLLIILILSIVHFTTV